jgi:histidine phosphotransferase ChpT
MNEPLLLSDLDLSALLCSRVCHDIISPVGAINTGLELLKEEEDEGMRNEALSLVMKSAAQASAKLQFCRIAFGAAGSEGALIDLGEAGEKAKAFVGEEKIRLEWNAPRENRPKAQVKLLLNMLLMAMASIPRGGTVTADVKDNVFLVRGRGDRAKVPEAIAKVLDGTAELEELDARLVQSYYAKRLAKHAGLTLGMAMDGADVLVKAA